MIQYTLILKLQIKVMKGCRNPKTQKSLTKSNTSSQQDRKEQLQPHKQPISQNRKQKSKTPNRPLRTLSKTLHSNQKTRQKSKQPQSKQPHPKPSHICALLFNKPKPKPNPNKTHNPKPPQQQQKISQIQLIRDKFNEAVCKVFNILDIFSRGTISQANISRWVPQAALYFLGSVFQKIRNNRLCMNVQEFQNQCGYVFEKSNYNDVKQFVENIFKYSNNNDEKLSLQGEHRETVESQVQDRFSFRVDPEHSFRQIKIGNNTMPLKTINTTEIINKNTTNQQKSATKHPKPTPLTDLNQYQNLLPNTANRRQKQPQNMPLQQKNNTKPNDKQNTKQLTSIQSPFFQVSISNVIAKVAANNTKVKNKKCSVETDRIDRLSLRLEDYIKQNAERIQRSKHCRQGI